VVVLPAQALANCRLGHPGNADLLASLRQWLGPSWVFDEYRHGLSAPRSAADRAPLLAFDLLGIHLAVFYLLAVVALAMRFGPPWKVDSRVPGSTAAFLVGLGRLHDRLGHHTEAARLLVERVGEFDVRVPLPERVGGEGRSGLLRLARELGRRQEVAGAGAGSGSGGA
jgi:hypothetical protein